MGTRGFVGFVVDGTEKIAYNGYDSYPDWLGVKVLKWLAGAVHDGRLPAVTAAVRQIEVVTNDVPPSEQQIEQLRRFGNAGVASQQLTDWYVLLRETQGDPAAMLEAGYIEDHGDFPTDSLFAEWGYVVDFDGEMFEVYRGFQHEPHTLGRFADRKPKIDGYWPVKLVAEWPFYALPTEGDLAGMARADD